MARNPATRRASREAQNLQRKVQRRIHILESTHQQANQETIRQLKLIQPQLKAIRGYGGYNPHAQARAQQLLTNSQAAARTSRSITRRATAKTHTTSTKTRATKTRATQTTLTEMSNTVYKEEMRKMARGEANALTASLGKGYQAGSDTTSIKARNRMLNRMFWQSQKDITRGRSDKYQALMEHYGTDSLQEVWHQVMNTPAMKKQASTINRMRMSRAELSQAAKDFRAQQGKDPSLLAEERLFWEKYKEQMALYARMM